MRAKDCWARKMRWMRGRGMGEGKTGVILPSICPLPGAPGLFLPLFTGKDSISSASSQFKDPVVTLLSYECFTSCVLSPKSIGLCWKRGVPRGHLGPAWELGQVSLPMIVEGMLQSLSREL